MQSIRKSAIFILFTATAITVFAGLIFGFPLLTAQYHRQNLEEKMILVQKLGLTDLCLFTDAPYTRHLSQADNFSAFKDSPLVFEHFPSGSMTIPPQLLNLQHKSGHTDLRQQPEDRQ